ncbi:uncharacterized protein LOC124298557 [Neodiprion virginianus]|uniref:uncharacterized protein LOC124298557 n=1 Tax=Neodiprion virginianus TaxID=2961670 RepID=UPI001EE6DC2D|nr:uncharacterized protein LOC124298557 [Neodiprion virginianus]
MFSNIERVRRTLICGPPELTETFMFEGAAHWAKQGSRVIYVTQNPIESLPPKYHDGPKPCVDTFQLIKFMYLPDHKSLMELLVELDTFASLPSALLIDKLDNYAEPTTWRGDYDVLLAKTCSFIIDAMNACSRILGKKVHVCASLRPETVGKVHFVYFDNVWKFSIDNNLADPIITLQKAFCTNGDRLFKFRSLEDRTVVLKQVLRFVDEH